MGDAAAQMDDLLCGAVGVNGLRLRYVAWVREHEPSVSATEEVAIVARARIWLMLIGLPARSSYSKSDTTARRRGGTSIQVSGSMR